MPQCQHGVVESLAVHDSFGGWQLHRILHDLCHDGVQVVILSSFRSLVSKGRLFMHMYTHRGKGRETGLA